MTAVFYEAGKLETEFFYPTSPVWIFEQQLTKRQLKKWIDKNWKEIESWMKLAPKQPKRVLGKIKLFEKILKLKEKDYSFKKIADELFVELNKDVEGLGEDLIDIDEDNVKAIYHRYKQYLKEIRKR